MGMGSKEIILVPVQFSSLDQLHREEICIMLPDSPSTHKIQPPTSTSPTVAGVKIVDHPSEVSNRDIPVGGEEEENDHDGCKEEAKEQEITDPV